VHSSYVPFGTACQKLPLPQVLQLIDEIYGVEGYYVHPYHERRRTRKCKFSENMKLQHKKEINLKSRRKKSTVDTKPSDSEPSSDDDWFSNDSSDDDGDDDSEPFVGDGIYGGSDKLADCPDLPPKISIKSLVINPQKARSTRSVTRKALPPKKRNKQTNSENQTKVKPTMLLPCILLERCDKLALSLQKNILNEKRPDESRRKPCRNSPSASQKNHRKTVIRNCSNKASSGSLFESDDWEEVGKTPRKNIKRQTRLSNAISVVKLTMPDFDENSEKDEKSDTDEEEYVPCLDDEGDSD